MCLTEVSGGGFWRGSLEEVSGGGLWRGSLEGVSGGGLWRGSLRTSFEEVSGRVIWRGRVSWDISGGGLLRGMLFAFCLIPDFHLVCLQSKEINMFVSLSIIFQRIIWLQTRHKRIVLGIKLDSKPRNS